MFEDLISRGENTIREYDLGKDTFAFSTLCGKMRSGLTWPLSEAP